MALVARSFNDLCSGICVGHVIPIPMTGVIIQMDSKILTDGSFQSEMTYMVKGNCGHTGVLISGSSKTFGSTAGFTRQGDTFSGTFSGTVVLGSAKVQSS